MKGVVFLGDSLTRLRAFPKAARQDAGFQIDRLQLGDTPDDWKSMRTIGKGVEEIRIRWSGSHYRVIYLSSRADAVYVLHAFSKKTRKTRKSDIDIARKRQQAIGV